jgi:hypothetical protein
MRRLPIDSVDEVCPASFAATSVDAMRAAVAASIDNNPTRSVSACAIRRSAKIPWKRQSRRLTALAAFVG